MALFKCKMCGGAVEFTPGATVGECDSCGTKQTLPRLDDERRINLYDRANHFRRANEYDKAMGIYETILAEDKTDAEAYWSLVLCRYGVEYVEDPASHKRVPTVNRAQYTSVLADVDYKSALQYADTLQKSIYEAEAKAIDDIQKGILEISQKEEPFDVFICYKETDANGRRTPDSVLATELYHELTKAGYKVFFSRITLEDKLGTAYEPYIFAALHSAKVMVVLGTKAEHFNAVWVKNEWSRYLALIQNGEKKTLIPAYKDMDPYDLPEAFSHLQAQDMAKLGFMQDLLHGIKKILGSDEKPQKETVVVQSTPGNANVTALIERGFMALEDGEWDRADGFFEEALNQDAKNALCYLGKLMAELKIRKREDLKNAAEPFDDRNNCKKASRFDAAIAKELADANAYIRERNETARKEKTYMRALAEYQKTTVDGYAQAAKLFASIPGYKDADKQVEESSKKHKEEHEREQRMADELEANDQAEAEKVIATFDAVIYAQITGQIDRRDSEMAEKQSSLNFLRTQRNSLGLFAGKEKKRLDSEIAKTTVDLEQIQSHLASLRSELNTFKTNAAEKALEDAKAESNETKRAMEREYTVAQAFHTVFNNSRVRQIVNMKRPDLCNSYQGFLTIPFGRYPQESDTSISYIEWLVLKVKENKALLISKYALDCQRFNTSHIAVTWETCSLRKWLNGTFFGSAFSTDEQTVIQSTTVTTDNNPSNNTPLGTKDKVFLLSISEVNKYFSTNKERKKCTPTEHAVAQGVQKDVYKTGGKATCFWWLRSVGSNYGSAASVDSDGSVFERGRDVNSERMAVRPALWINLRS